MEKTFQAKPAALIICFTHLDKDPRVLRQISWLRDEYQITTLGRSASGVEDIDHIQYTDAAALPQMEKIKKIFAYVSGRHERFYWNENRSSYIEKLKDKKFDLIIANDFDALPIGVRLKEEQNAKLVFDAHEYSPLEFTESLRWRLMWQPLIKHICREYIPRATSATTVCRGIAEMYEREYGKKFEVITNATGYEKLKPSPTERNKIRLIYHGFAHPSRKSHRQIEMMRLLPGNFELNLMLVGEADYIESLKKTAESQPNVKFLPPVATSEIANFINQFDVGVYSLPPTNFNNKHALPNKFFEFIQARLAVVVAPSPEMARIVREYDLGVVAEDFSPESMADAVKDLTAEKIDYFKAQSAKYAYELSAEKNRERYLRLIESII